MASFTFTVSERAGTPMVLTGTASPSTFRLQTLTVVLTGTDHLIKQINVQDKLTVTTAQKNALSAMGMGSTITFNGDLAGNGDFTVTGMLINGEVISTVLLSGFPAAAATGTEDN